MDTVNSLVYWLGAIILIGVLATMALVIWSYVIQFTYRYIMESSILAMVVLWWAGDSHKIQSIARKVIDGKVPEHKIDVLTVRSWVIAIVGNIVAGYLLWHFYV